MNTKPDNVQELIHEANQLRLRELIAIEHWENLEAENTKLRKQIKNLTSKLHANSVDVK